MENQIASDSLLLLYSVGLGLGFGLFYEIFRFLRIALPHAPLTVALEDILFFIPVTISILIFQFVFSQGEVRWFSLFGITVGFLLYLKTVGRILKRFSVTIITILKKILFLLYSLTLSPLIKVFKKITVCLFSKTRKIAIMIKEKRRIKSRLRQKKKFLLRAAEGFLK